MGEIKSELNPSARSRWFQSRKKRVNYRKQTNIMNRVLYLDERTSVALLVQWAGHSPRLLQMHQYDWISHHDYLLRR